MVGGTRPRRAREIVSRTLAATFGGYGVAALCAVLPVVALPMPRSEAVQLGMLVSVPVWIAVWMWMFAVRSPERGWLGIVFWLLVLGALCGLFWVVGPP